MKKLITLIVLLFPVCIFSQEVVTVSFQSLDQCETHVRARLEKHKAAPVEELLADLSIPVEGDSELGLFMEILNKKIESSEGVRYIEKIGSIALGDFIKRVGYVVKHETFCVFYEVSIGKIDQEDYRIVDMTFLFQESTQDLVEEIPEYYWK